jgi:hypothetical protein
MKSLTKAIGFTFVLLAVLVSGCASTTTEPTPVPPTFTASPVPSTNTPEPTATSTSVPPSPIPTEPPGPTPSGEFEFFDVTLELTDKNTAYVSFGYQLENDMDLDGAMIMAQAITQGATCDSGKFAVFSKPYFVKEFVLGMVEEADSTFMNLQEAGKCSFKGFTLKVLDASSTPSNPLYEEDFEIPFELEKE